MVDDRAAYVALALTPGIGGARLATLLDACQTANGALAAPFEFLCHLPGFSRAAATAIRAARPEKGAQVLADAEGLGARCLTPPDADFPDVLREIPDAPALLFAAGDLSLLDRGAVAIVGSRDHSSYGAEVCRSLSSRAAQANLAVVSGMARGLDAMAHTAALDAGGTTIGVLGNGFGVFYPAANRDLYERVARDGLLLTAFPPGERPHVGSFPRRNRLISGLARVTIVVEAAATSGTLITVEAALAQGREVMAVPGPVTSPTSVGTNRLIRDGATPLLEPDDFLQFYPEAGKTRRSLPVFTPDLAALPNLSAEEQRVVAALTSAPLHLDLLAEHMGQPVGELLAVLCGLEVEGVVEQVGGGVFRIKRTGD